MAWPIVLLGEQAGPVSRHWVRALFPFALFLLALVPRLVAINRYITPDELLWVYRSIQLREAVADGRWGDTLVAGHPGVTTTWLGAAGISAQLIVDSGSRADYDWLTKMAALLPDNPTAFIKLSGFLTVGRIAVALVNSLSVVLIYLLVRRLWGFGVAALAGLLLALDPFAAGLSGLMHVDALSASFATLALLSLGIAVTWDEVADNQWGLVGMLALSGVATGLAVLTKTPTILLGLVAAIVFVVWFVALGGELFSPRRRQLLLGILVYGGVLGLTTLVLLPAVWASPVNVLATLSGNANRHLDEALRPTFFLGDVAFVHGPLFYPFVLLWRNGPVVVAAVVPLTLLLIGRRRARTWQLVGRDSVLPVFALVVWIGLFLALITVAAKKFDRYALPIIPAVIILAALVWVVWSQRNTRRRTALPWILVGVQAVYLVIFIGYPLAAYNPLVGGPYTAVHILPMGWGEGISASGRWLTATQPSAADDTAMAGIVPSLAPFFPGQTLVETNQPAAAATYIIHTLTGRQADSDGFEADTAGLDLLETIRFGGLDQAWVYRNPDPIAIPQPPPLASPVIFGERIALNAVSTTFVDDSARLAVEWERLAMLTEDERFIVRIEVRDAQGAIWAADETDLLNSVYFYPPDWESPESGVVHYTLELTPAIPPDTYDVDITVVDARNGNQLAARTADGTFGGVTVTAGTIEVPRPDSVVSAARVVIPQELDQLWLDGSLQLLGTGIVPDEALAGSRLPLDLFWHTASGALPAGLALQWSLRPADGGVPLTIDILPLSRLDSGEWRTGETITEKVRLTLPAAAQPGLYDLVFTLQDVSGTALGSSTVLDQIRLNNIDRSYSLPSDLPLQPQTCFADMLCLQGVAPEGVVAPAGGTAEFTLYWQAEAIPDGVYTVFLHMVDAAGNIVVQADHWPGGLPTDILDQGQVITDEVVVPIPTELPPGTYDMRVGLYSTTDGQRLPVSSSVAVSGEDYLLFHDFFVIDGP